MSVIGGDTYHGSSAVGLQLSSDLLGVGLPDSGAGLEDLVSRDSRSLPTTGTRLGSNSVNSSCVDFDYHSDVYQPGSSLYTDIKSRANLVSIQVIIKYMYSRH